MTSSQSLSSDRQAQRKAQQFFRQAQRALNLALADRNDSDGMNGLFVEEVCPAPDCGRHLVRVAIPDGWPVVDALGALRRDTPRLRSEDLFNFTGQLWACPSHCDQAGSLPAK